MANSNDTTTTTNAAAAEQPKSAAKKPKGDVLLFNEHGGPYLCTIVTPIKGVKGAGKDDPMSRNQIERIKVLPGLQLVSPEDFDKMAPNEGFRDRVKSQHMTIINDDAKLTWQKAWGELRTRRCEELIEHSADKATLEKILEQEKREDVAEALRRQLAQIEGAGTTRAAARRAQRAHNRAGRRSRSSGLLD